MKIGFFAAVAAVAVPPPSSSDKASVLQQSDQQGLTQFKGKIADARLLHIKLPKHSTTGVVTFVDCTSPKATQMVDAANILGLSVKGNTNAAAHKTPMLALTLPSLDDNTCSRLTQGGWEILAATDVAENAELLPDEALSAFATRGWPAAFAKMDLLRLPLEKLLYLDASAYVRSSKALAALSDKDIGDALDSGAVAFASDSRSLAGFNDIAMVFKPSQALFRDVASRMTAYLEKDLHRGVSVRRGPLSLPEAIRTSKRKLLTFPSDIAEKGEASLIHFGGPMLPTEPAPPALAALRAGTYAGSDKESAMAYWNALVTYQSALSDKLQKTLASLPSDYGRVVEKIEEPVAAAVVSGDGTITAVRPSNLGEADAEADLKVVPAAQVEGAGHLQVMRDVETVASPATSMVLSILLPVACVLALIFCAKNVAKMVLAGALLRKDVA
mmetsp:Transcript_11299/g.25026  ORF Transcript_11299/g.25026 Transcript_11299/m.25026 type:complete len:443 (-) Transcript_11299:50-1378(-)